MSQNISNSIVGTMLIQNKKKTNAIAWIAPVAGILGGFLLWRFGLGADGNFTHPDPAGGFWPQQQGPKWGLARMYQGGIIVPLLLGALLTVLIFVVERWRTIGKASGTRPIPQFIRQLQYTLAIDHISTAVRECDIQRGSLGKVIKLGLLRYQEMASAPLDHKQKLQAIQKDLDEVGSVELHGMEQNLVFLSTIASVATLLGLLGTVTGMITSFAALGESGGGEAAQRLSQGISEALYNTALGIGTSAVSIIMYNVFTTRIDAVAQGIQEGAYTLTQSFDSQHAH